jgi:MFS family permease
MPRLRPSLRPLLASYLLVGSVEWMLAVALTTVVYDRTGSTGWVALTLALRFLPAVLLAPMGGVLADRMDRRRLMATSCALRAAALLALAAAAAVEAPPVVLVALAVVDAALVTPYRPAALAVLPSLAPGEDLSRANAAVGGVIQLTWVLGPAVGAAAVVVSPTFAFVLAALALAGAALAAAAIAGDGLSGCISVELPRSPPQMLRDGALALRSAPGAGALLVLMMTVELVFGFELVAHVAVAAERLGIGAEGAGWMTAFVGLGGVLGASLAALAARGHRAGVILSLAGAGFGIALAVLAALTSVPLAFGLLLCEGLANVLYDVLTVTLLQRLLSGGLLARGQALTDALGAVALTAGSLAAPVIIGALGLSGALVAVGGVMVLAALLVVVPLACVDRQSAARVGALAPVVERFRATALFALAPYGTVERLAGAAVAVTVPAGAVVVHEGDRSDCLYIVESGRLAVTVRHGGARRPVTELGEGDWFGEIGVMRGGERTATVAAVAQTRLWRIPANDILAAVDATIGIADPLRRGVSVRLARTDAQLQTAGPPAPS